MLQVRQLFVVRHFLVTVGTRMERGTALRTLRPIGVVARDHRVAELPIAVPSRAAAMRRADATWRCRHAAVGH